METVPHVVLEYDKWSDCALVALTDDARSAVRDGTDMPYLVTSGYHRGSRTWARATPFGDITRAKVVFEHRVGRDYTPNEGRLHDDEIIACRWRRGDIAGILEESLDDMIFEDGWKTIHDRLDPRSFDLGVGRSKQAIDFYEHVFDCGGDPDSNVHVWPAVEDGGAHVCVCPVSSGEHDLAVYSVDVDKIGDGPITVRDLDSIGTREVHVDDFWEKPEEVRLFLRTDADVYLFGSSLGKSLTVEDRAGDDIAPALREVRTYCKDATEKRDPQIIGGMAQAAAAKSATAEGDAGGKKL